MLRVTEKTSGRASPIPITPASEPQSYKVVHPESAHRSRSASTPMAQYDLWARMMRLLLTSSGISNTRIHDALVELLGKPIAESSALFITTGIYALPGGAEIARRVIRGSLGDPFCELGWKSLGLLELTALPSIKEENWVPMLQQTDALLVGGGDCQYLCYWMQQSGLADLLPSTLQRTVYVGLSAESMVISSYGTTYGGHTLPAFSDKSLVSRPRNK